MSEAIAKLSTSAKFSLVILLNIPFLSILAIYDTVGAIGPQLQRAGIVHDIQSIGYLYMAYSILTPVLVIVAGIVVDKWGQKVASWLCLTPMIIGGIMIWFSGDMFWVFFAGRVLTGFADALYVVQSRLIGILFEAEWLSLAFAFSTVIGQLGNIIVFTVLPLIASTSLWAAMGSTLFLSVLALISICIFFLLDGRYQFTKTEGHTSPFALSDVKEFPISFWCMVAINCFSTCSIFVVMSFGPSFLVEKDFTEVEAGLIVAGMNGFVLISPITCWIIDKVGHRCLIWGICNFTMILGFIMLALDFLNPLIWLLLIGFAFAILNPSVYSSFPMVVKESLLGTAYGFVGLTFDAGLLMYPFVVGSLMANYGSWLYVHIFFGSTNLIGLTACLIIYFTDKENIFLLPISKMKGYQVIEEIELDEKQF